MYSYSIKSQARIVALNAHYFLKNGGHFVISIKASCIDSTAAPEAVFAREVKKLQGTYIIFIKCAVQYLYHGRMIPMRTLYIPCSPYLLLHVYIIFFSYHYIILLVLVSRIFTTSISWTIETSGTINVRALWERSCCCCRHLQSAQESLNYYTRSLTTLNKSLKFVKEGQQSRHLHDFFDDILIEVLFVNARNKDRCPKMAKKIIHGNLLDRLLQQYLATKYNLLRYFGLFTERKSYKLYTELAQIYFIV